MGMLNHTDDLFETPYKDISNAQIMGLKTMFEAINEDCASDPDESEVPLSDIDFYAEQIANLSEGFGADLLTWDQCVALAEKISKLSVD